MENPVSTSADFLKQYSRISEVRDLLNVQPVTESNV